MHKWQLDQLHLHFTIESNRDLNPDPSCTAQLQGKHANLKAIGNNFKLLCILLYQMEIQLNPFVLDLKYPDVDF